MARPTNLLVLHVSTGTPRALELACPACGRDSMFEFPLLTLTARGVNTIGLLQLCDACHGQSDD